MICPNCGFDSPAEMRFCGSCGTRLTAACAECGFGNPLHYRFCGMCGVKLTAAVVQPPLEEHLPQVTAKAGDLLPPVASMLEGERRVVTVVLTDLTNSTTLLERLGTESWVELMSRILHILESEINRFGGEVSQFRGDGMVAFFGAASAHEDDPERAVLAALSMQRSLELYVRELAQPEAVDLQMRVGVNTGEVIVASNGARQNWEEAAMGMAVAVAARMETAAEPGTVLVSENTYRLVESQFDWQSLGVIPVKGVSKPIAVYRPLVPIVVPKQLLDRQILLDSIPRIGRDAEFHLLKDCVVGLFEGRGRIAVLTGDKGSGKSFLVNEVSRYFTHLEALLTETQSVIQTAAFPLTWVSGRCRSYSQTLPYSMWQDLFRDWLGMRPDESKEEKSASLRRRAEELWGDDVEEHYPYIATFLGLPLEEAFTEKIRHLDGEELRQRLFLAVRSWIEASSRLGPVVLGLSNMQWADDSSLSLLKYCLPVCDNEALLWLLSFRSDRDAKIWEFYHYLEAVYPHRLTDVELHLLTEDQSLELIGHLIGQEALPLETCNLIIHNAGGNPYYIVELIRSLMAKGVLTRDTEDGPWKVTRTVTSLDLPESLQLLLLSRIDRLSAQERLVLQIGAVIGPVFWLNMVQALLVESPTLKADLAALQRTQFIQESGRVPELGMQYLFKSPLIRDTAYESLLSAQKAAYHFKAAEFLENAFCSDYLEGYDGVLAYHYRGAGNPYKELFYTILAADRARKIYASAEALQHYTRALELLDSLQNNGQSEDQVQSILTQRFEVLNGRREVYFHLGQFEASRADTLALLPLARQLPDDPAWLVDALLAQAEMSVDNREELIPGLQMAEEALTIAQRLGDQHREMRCLVYIANGRFKLKTSGWQDLAEQALALTRQLGDLKMEVNLLLSIGNAYGMDDLPSSRDYLKAALAQSEKLNDKAIEITLLNALGQQYERDGDYHRQLTEYEQKRLHLSREIGSRIEEGSALMHCGQIQALYLGDQPAGLELVRQALHIWESITRRLFPLLRIAQIQSELGYHVEALATLDQAEPLAGKVVADIGRAGLNLVRAIVCEALGDEQNLCLALELTSQIQQMVAEQLVSRQYQMSAACKAAVAHLKMADILAVREGDNLERQSHLLQALEVSQMALNLYLQFGFVQVVECTSEEIFFRHSQSLAANNHTVEAAEYLQKAYQEMIRKFNFIPVDSPFQITYLENIQLHKDIQTAYANTISD